MIRRVLAVGVAVMAVSGLLAVTAQLVGQPSASGVPAGPSSASAPAPGQFGVYDWSLDLSGYDAGAGTDILSWGAGLVAGTGVRTIRVYLGSNDVYRLGVGGADPLRAIATRPAYARLFSDPRFDTYLLTAYSSADMGNAWVDGLDAAEAAAERAEISALGRRLLRTYPGKRFVILNWEGDNALSSAGGSAVAWSGFRDWIGARAAGVRDAQSAFAGGAERLLSGLEFNRVAGCGPERRCVVSEIAPFADVDLFSYSSWESIGTGGGAAQRLTGDLDAALGLIRSGHPDAGRADLIVGEFGLAREIPDAGECVAAQVFRSVADAMRDWGVRYAIFWQIVDNPPDAAAVWSGFGLVKYDGTGTLVKRELAGLLNGRAPGVPDAAGCPRINAGGVVNGRVWSTRIAAGDTVSIFGNGFAGAGDRVQVEANGRRYVIEAGSADWYDSPHQINARLPAGIGGTIVVYVSRADGIDSNGQALSLTR